MRSRRSLFIALVLLVIALVFIDRLGVDRFSLLSSGFRQTSPAKAASDPIVAETATPASPFGPHPNAADKDSSTPTATPPAEALSVVQTTPTPDLSLPGGIITETYAGFDPVSQDELWTDLAGLSNKTNQERQKYVAEHLFPMAGLAGISEQSVPYTGSFGPEYGNWDGLGNVIARRHGTLPDSSRKLIVLGAHFDKVTYPRRSPTGEASDGIFDNGTGVTIVAKIIQAMKSPFNDIEVVAFASEEPEPYFLGSRVYFRQSTERQRILFFANFDCLGRGNLAFVDKAEDSSLSGLAEQVAYRENLPIVWRTDVEQLASDNLVAQAYGVKTLYFTSDGFDWRNIHGPVDNINEVYEEEYYRHYLTSLQIVAYLDSYLASTSSAP